MTRLFIGLLALVVWLAHNSELAIGTTDGRGPQAPLVVSGATLFGTTCCGGPYDEGTIFAVNTDGSDYRVVYYFGPGHANGTNGLTSKDSTLYGTTLYAGGADHGTVFSINADGSGFTTLHAFAGGADDGRHPNSTLVLNGSTLFGTTLESGDGGWGTLFSIDTDGTDYTLVHEFAGGTDDGSEPKGALLAGSALIGITSRGGDYDLGTIYSVNADGSDFTILHEFAGGADDGRSPTDLILSGSSLYGTARGGGDNDDGIIYSMATDGSGFTILHEFSELDGRVPYGLTPSGLTLFGTTGLGGSNGRGTVFSINTDGSEFTLLHDFGPDWWVGGPRSEPVLIGETLFGTTYLVTGAVYSLNTDGSDFVSLHRFGGNVPGPDDPEPIVPEPGTIVLTLLGLSMMGVRISRNNC